MSAETLPVWLKLAYAAYLAVMIPTYALRAAAGPRNFLWFSDVALFGGAVALWLENSFIASTMAVLILVADLVWNVSFFGRLLTGRTVVGIADYMFDPREHWYMRTLSLFHLFTPVILVWLVWRLGYDSRALLAATLLTWVLLPLTYAITDPAHNINRVFGPFDKPQQRMHPLAYLAVLMVGTPIVVYLPTHLVLRAIFTN